MNKTTVQHPDSVAFARALADKTRQEIMKLCCCEWSPVGELAATLKLTQPTISHHLAILREAGLVNVRPEGRQTFYTLNQEQVAVCCGTLILDYAPDVVEKSNAAEGA